MVEHLSDEQLTGYALQTITDEEREHINQHLQQCTHCRTHLSRHETTVRRIRYGLAADLRQVKPSSRSEFASVAAEVRRSRRWNVWRVLGRRGLAVSPQLVLWLAVVAILIVIGQSFISRQPADLATYAVFENRNLRLYTEQPALPVGPEGAWDSWSVNPGAVIFHDGQFHMFYNGKTLNDSNISIGYATSPDGLTWTRASANPVLSASLVSWMPNAVHISANSVLFENGQWVLYFTTSNNPKHILGVVGRATAPSPLGPWTVNAEPAVEPSMRVDWDGGLVGDACVTRTESGYVMYYVGGTVQKMIGRADSTDGVTWTKYNDPTTTKAPEAYSDPVLKADQDWEAIILDKSCTRQVDGRWVMTYVSNTDGGIGYAVSLDGLHWQKSEQNPIFLADLSKEHRELLGATLAIQDRTAFLYFQPDLTDGRGIYVATWREP